MPSAITHYLMGLRLSKYLKENYPDLKFSETALLWGAQGPDFLFAFNSAGQPNMVKKFGKDLHAAQSEKMLQFLCSFARASANETDTGYILGFFTHYALDSTTHPFVICRSREMAAESENMDEHLCHLKIESNLDVIMLRYEQGKVTNELRSEEHTSELQSPDHLVCR